VTVVTKAVRTDRVSPRHHRNHKNHRLKILLSFRADGVAADPGAIGTCRQSPRAECQLCRRQHGHHNKVVAGDRRFRHIPAPLRTKWLLCPSSFDRAAGSSRNRPCRSLDDESLVIQSKRDFPGISADLPADRDWALNRLGQRRFSTQGQVRLADHWIANRRGRDAATPARSARVGEGQGVGAPAHRFQ
jgi:hypothetical protein